MKRILLIIVLVFTFAAMAGPVWADESHVCDHDATTIESLHHCVMHAAEMRHITNQGVANSLLQQVNAAHSAADRGQTGVAVNGLRAFVSEVKAQSGVHVEAEHAAHLISHAERVIAALRG